MYDEKIEALISAALADGVLTEKEKQVLFKRAQAEGIDLDEFEMVLDARLVELQKAEKEKAEKSAPKSNKLGDVKKCPNCGAIVQSYQGKCHECGYEFEDVEANAAVKELSSLLKNNKRKEDADEIIMGFPIPSTKANLIEFMSYLQSNATSKGNGEAFAAKLQECIIKAKTFYSTDAQLTLLVKNIEEAEKKRLAKVKSSKNKENLRKGIKLFLRILPWLIVLTLVVLEWVFLYGELDWHAFWVVLLTIVTLGAGGYGAFIMELLIWQ